MHMSQHTSRLLAQASRSVAIGLFAAVSTFTAHAQGQAATTTQPKGDLQASLKAPLDLSTPSDLSYSSSTGADEAVAAERFNLSGKDDMQPPPRRRRYGRPNYNDRMHNSDGSSKLAVVVGGGFTLPTGSTGKQLNLSYRFQGGLGYNFSKKFGIIGQFDYDHFGLQGSVIQQQQAVYNSLGIIDPNTGQALDVSGLDANAHIWSLTLNPTFTFYDTEKNSAYVVVGGGFYRKTVNFTLPQTGQYCDFYGYCYQITQNQTFDQYTSSAGGVNGGIGFTHKLSRFASQKVFAEARYVWVDNQQSNNPQNYYPAAYHRTGYFPVTVGLRW